MKNYLIKAKKLYSSNFRIYGIGHFDIEDNEVAEILKLLDEGDYKSLDTLYERLSKQRMG